MSTGIITLAGYHNRRSTRLKGFDYSKPGFYFVTVCIHDTKQSLFGEIINGKMVLNRYGKIVRDEWVKTSQKRDNVKIDEFIIMPNHMHGIIQICNNDQDANPVGAYCHTPSIENKTNGAYVDTPLRENQINGINVDTPLRENQTNGINVETPLHKNQMQKLKSPSNTVGSIVRGFKGVAKILINLLRNTPGKVVWQRNYHDHIVRDDGSLSRIRQYIRNNPLQWSIKNAQNHLHAEVEAFTDDKSWESHYIHYPS